MVLLLGSWLAVTREVRVTDGDSLPGSRTAEGSITV